MKFEVKVTALYTKVIRGVPHSNHDTETRRVEADDAKVAIEMVAADVKARSHFVSITLATATFTMTEEQWSGEKKKETLKALGVNERYVILHDGSWPIAVADVKERKLTMCNGFYAADYAYPGNYGRFEVIPTHAQRLELIIK